MVLCYRILVDLRFDMSSQKIIAEGLHLHVAACSEAGANGTSGCDSWSELV